TTDGAAAGFGFTVSVAFHACPTTSLAGGFESDALGPEARVHATVATTPTATTTATTGPRLPMRSMVNGRAYVTKSIFTGPGKRPAAVARASSSCTASRPSSP